MRKLTQREKGSLAFLGLFVLATVGYLLIWPLISNWRLAYAELGDKRQQLEIARKLNQMEDSLVFLSNRASTELGIVQDSIINDELFKRISEKFSVGDEEGKIDINKATIRSLSSIEGIDTNMAMQIIEHGRLIGGYTSLDQLKEIKRTVFDSGSERPAIIARLSQLARESGVNKIEQFNIRPASSSKPVSVGQITKLELVKKLYLAELDLQKEALEKGKPLKEKLLFPLIPSEVPDPMKSKLIDKIKTKGNPLSEDEVKLLIDEFAAELSPSEEPTNGDAGDDILALEDEFAELMGDALADTDEQQPEQTVAEPAPLTLDDVDPGKILNALMDYNRQVKVERNMLTKIVGNIPASYRPKIYLVDLFFKSNLETVVKFLTKTLESAKWLEPKGLKLSIADEKHENLSVQVTIIATAL